MSYLLCLSPKITRDKNFLQLKLLVIITPKFSKFIMAAIYFKQLRNRRKQVKDLQVTNTIRKCKEAYRYLPYGLMEFPLVKMCLTVLFVM